MERLLEDERVPMTAAEQNKIIEEVLDEVLGLGPLETLLKEPTISDILVNRYNKVFIERNGKLEVTEDEHVDLMRRKTADLFAACTRIGAVHSVVFGGFAARELATRIEDAKPRVIISASCGIEVKRIIPYKPLLDGALDLCSHKPAACVIVQVPVTGLDVPA